MKGQQTADLRSALRGAIQRRSSDRSVSIREETRLGAARSRKLLDVIAQMDVTGRAVVLTQQAEDGSTLLVCVCGIGACGDGSVAG